MVIGVTDEDDATIRAFQKGVPMEYPVATDKDGALAMKMGIRGIPTAFLVNKAGEIIWQGHPMQLETEDGIDDENIAKILE